MGLYLIIESDEKASKTIQEVISSIDGQAVFKTFANLASFYKENAEKKITEELSLIVIEYSSAKKLNEWKVELLNFRKNLATEENPEFNQQVQVLMSSFDDPATPHRTLVTLPINNFIFKPYDVLVLKETINAALNFRKRLAALELKSFKSSSSIGILKDIELFSVSELGFVTFSDIQLNDNSVSKFFCPVFSYNKKQSAWAQCLHSFPHPTKEKTFVNQFQFYGVESAFLMNIRKYIATNKLRKTNEFALNLVSEEATLQTKIGILSTDLEMAAKLQEDLTHHFKNIEIEIVHFTNAPDLAKRTNLQTFDTVLNLTELMPEEFSKLFKATAKYFWLNTKLEDDEKRKELAAFYKDISYLPIDRSYLYKKLKLHHPEWQEKEPSSFMTVTAGAEKMKSANLLKISEISEIFVNFNYTRELLPKTSREFIFIAEDETNLVELPAFCHFAEPSKGEKGKFFHQFVFFGMTDHYLKQVRLWLTQDYIKQNQKDG